MVEFVDCNNLLEGIKRDEVMLEGVAEEGRVGRIGFSHVNFNNNFNSQSYELGVHLALVFFCRVIEIEFDTRYTDRMDHIPSFLG